MGILDDAIKEHLELKRKHGVPEEEVERQEEEALGPARREVAQQPEDADLTAADADHAAVPADGEPIAVDDAPLFDGEGHAPPEAETTEAQPAEVHAAEPHPAEPHVSEAHPAEPSSAPEPEPILEEEPVERTVAGHTGLEEPLDEPDEDAVLGDTEPHGFPAVEEDEEAGKAGGDEEDEEHDEDEDDPDVLEDTPDFLQETPEHDRLWFEQKPPRDFDFD